MSLTSLRTASSLWHDVLVAVGPYRPHTMLVGPPEETEAFVEALREDLVGPICTVDGASVCEFPNHARTIILRNLDALDTPGQRALMDRIDSSKGLQIVSLAEQAPFSRVQRGLLLEALYRRLSLIYLETSGN